MLYNHDKFKRLKSFIRDYLENGSTAASKIYYDDPTTLTFNFWVIFEGKDSPLFNEQEDAESAIRYLNNIGEEDRANALKEIKNILKDLVEHYPYFFQTITGLEKVHLRGKMYSDEPVKITTLESIDLRITKIIELYNYVVYDLKYHRWMLPENLRWFKAVVTVSEIRNIRTFIKSISNTTEPTTNGGNSVIDGNVNYVKDRITNSGGGARLQNMIINNNSPNQTVSNTNDFPDNMQNISSSLSMMVYEMYKCEFKLEDGSDYMSDLSVNPESMAENSLTIQPTRIIPNHDFKNLDFGNGGNINFDPSEISMSKERKSYKDELKRMLNDRVSQLQDIFKGTFDSFLQENDPRLLASRKVYDVIGKVDSTIKALALGNVLGLSNFDNKKLHDIILNKLKDNIGVVNGSNTNNTQELKDNIDLNEVSDSSINDSVNLDDSNNQTINDSVDLNEKSDQTINDSVDLNEKSDSSINETVDLNDGVNQIINETIDLGISDNSSINDSVDLNEKSNKIINDFVDLNNEVNQTINESIDDNSSKEYNINDSVDLNEKSDSSINETVDLNDGVNQTINETINVGTTTENSMKNEYVGSDVKKDNSLSDFINFVEPAVNKLKNEYVDLNGGKDINLNDIINLDDSTTLDKLKGLGYVTIEGGDIDTIKDLGVVTVGDIKRNINIPLNIDEKEVKKNTENLGNINGIPPIDNIVTKHIGNIVMKNKTKDNNLDGNINLGSKKSDSLNRNNEESDDGITKKDC